MAEKSSKRDVCSPKSVRPCTAQSNSTMEEETFSYRWDVHNFKNLFNTLKQGGAIKSDVFKGDTTAGHSWSLHVKKTKEAGKEFVGLYLTLKKLGQNNESRTMFANYRFSILDKNNKPILKSNANTGEFLSNGKFLPQGCPKLLNPNEKKYIVLNTLRIYCRIWIQKDILMRFSRPLQPGNKATENSSETECDSDIDESDDDEKEEMIESADEEYNLDLYSGRAITKLKEEIVGSFRWDIQNFADIFDRLEHTGYLTSALFKGGKTTGHSWCMHLEKTENRKEITSTLYLSLVGVSSKVDDKSDKENSNEAIEENNDEGAEEDNEEDSEVEEVRAHYQFSVLDKNDKPIETLKFDTDGFKEGDWGHGYEIVNPTEGKYTPGDTLRIHCVVWTHKERVQQVSFHHDRIIQNNRNQMYKDFHKMMESGAYHDIVILTDSGEFKAHKSVLTSRSHYFATELNTEMCESTSGTIHINDFSDATIKQMLTFLYIGEVDNIKENALDLVRIGDKYDIQDLVKYCSEIILSTLTCENVVAIFLAISICDVPELKSRVSQYIALNIEVIKHQPAFPKILAAEPELMCKVLFCNPTL